MIPLRDNVPASRFPIVNTLLILANGLVFLVEASFGGRSLNSLVYTWGLVPALFWRSETSARWIPLLTSMFLHGSWWHLFSNMFALYIFGDNIEDRLGAGRYLLFYLFGGILAGLIHTWAYADSSIPTIGASGAIAAVLGGYLLLYPRARVLTLLPVPFFFPVIEVPALLYLGFWFLSQLLNGVAALGADTFQGGGVAWWAHIGGFVAGLLTVRLFALGTRQQYRYPDQYRPW